MRCDEFCGSLEESKHFKLLHLPFSHSHKFSMNLCAGNIKLMAASIVKFRLAENEDIVKVTKNFHEKLKEVRSTFGKVNVAATA